MRLEQLPALRGWHLLQVLSHFWAHLLLTPTLAPMSVREDLGPVFIRALQMLATPSLAIAPTQALSDLTF